MYLTKLLMKDFGKFHNKEVDLKPGINIIFGNQDSGKSTIRDFLIAMIYGVDRKEGISRVRSDYERRKPEGRSSYSGAAYIKKEGTNYLVERSFLAGAKSTSVLDVNSIRKKRLNIFRRRNSNIFRNHLSEDWMSLQRRSKNMMM